MSVHRRVARRRAESIASMLASSRNIVGHTTTCSAASARRAASERGSTTPTPLRIASIARPWGAQPSGGAADASAAGSAAWIAANSVPNHASDDSVAAVTPATVHVCDHHAVWRDTYAVPAAAAIHAAPAAASSAAAGIHAPSAAARAPPPPPPLLPPPAGPAGPRPSPAGPRRPRAGPAPSGGWSVRCAAPPGGPGEGAGDPL